MSTLFVDVDDTLTLYDDDNAWKALLGVGVPNDALVERIRAWDGPVVIWSGGGQHYARDTGKHVPGDLSFTALKKGLRDLAARPTRRHCRRQRPDPHPDA